VTKCDASQARPQKSLRGQFGKFYDQRKIGNTYPLTLAAAVYLPWLELVCAVAILFRWRERGALRLVLMLCSLFTIALASVWWRGLDISCGCFGHGDGSTMLPLALARSGTLGLIALLLLNKSTQATVRQISEP
jgi:hypothetical protein